MRFRPLPSIAERPRSHSGGALKGLTWLFSGLVVIATWVFVVEQTGFERQQAIDEAVVQNINRAIAFEQYVQRTLEVAAISTRYVAGRFQSGEAGTEFAGTPERPALLPDNLIRNPGTFVAVAIADANGHVIAASRALPNAVNVTALPAFRVHQGRDSDDLFVSPPMIHPVLRRNVILLTRRLNHPDGSFAGVVSLTILPEQFTTFYRDAHVGQSDVMSLIGLDGITRARRTGSVASSGEDLRGGLVMRMQARNPNGTYIGPSVLDGQVRYFSHRRLPNYPLFATYGILQSEVLASPNRRARILIAASAFATLVTVAFAILLTLLINRNQRRAAEIAGEHARLEEAQRIGEMGDWRYDTETTATHWSPQLYRMHERDPALGPIATDDYRALLDDEGREALDRAVAGVFKAREDQLFDIKVRLPSGAEAWHQVSAVPVVDAQDDVIGLRGTSQDITDRKRLARLETHVAHLSRIEAMSAMATTLAHELNQPLAAAANYLVGSRRRLEVAPTDRAGVEEGMAAAEQQIHFAGDIIRRVREMVANQPKTLSNFTLSSVIDDAVTLIAGAAGGPAPEIAKQLETGAGRVHADRVQVQQVLINLLRNALQATESVPNPRIVVASKVAEHDMVMLSVSDNGPGFSQPRAVRFSPFTSDSAAGMGLGLSISRTIVESNGGRIWTEDRDEGGALVCFTLPKARKSRARARSVSEHDTSL